MWHYTGPADSTRTHPKCVTGEVVTAWLCSITGACDNPRGARRVKPFRTDNPPPNEAWTNWFSPVSNGNPAEEEEGSHEGGMESAEYVSDSGETEEESEEEEGEDEEQSSPPPPPEPRTKRRHEPVTPSAPPAAPNAPPAPPVVPSALPATPVAPSARSTKRTRDAAASDENHRSRCLSEDDPMDTDNVATSQQVGLPLEVIHLEEDDQKRPEQASVPVLEVAPPATAPAMDVPPTETMPSTETALIAAEPTGAGLGMPKDSLVAPGPSIAQYDAQRLPEDQVGAAKEAMVQKTCEMGSAYNALKVEKVQLATELEEAVHDLAGVKGALAAREKSLEESREANKALVAETERMGKQRTELMGQMKVMSSRCISQEKYVSDWARKMIALLGDFCMDAEAEAADVERSVISNVPLSDDAN
ncbi:hypothetical protein ZWY2020_004579 [Hordeum vulgare]|nr:hypothetical protein ZWY2020_004579 [Hordeum vulgare]